MKKAVILILSMVCCLGAGAQKKHALCLGVGVGAGTNGAGVDASIGLTRFVQIRAGINYLPSMNFDTQVDIYNQATPIINALQMAGTIPQLIVPENVNIKIRPNMLTYHALVDIFPGDHFHFTVGAYMGQESPFRAFVNDGSLMPITISNSAIALYNNRFPDAAVSPIGVHLGDYIFTPDADGNAEAEVRVQKIRPYVGIGFGRAVPRKHRVGMSLDIGAQYWGIPTFYCNEVEVNPSSVLSSDKAKLWGTLSTIPVYPVVTLRIAGRLL